MHIVDALALDTGVSAREKARLKRLAKKRPVEGGGDKVSSKRQQVAQGGKAAPADEVWRSNRLQISPYVPCIVGRLHLKPLANACSTHPSRMQRRQQWHSLRRIRQTGRR